MKVSQIAEIIEMAAPKNLALDCDNVGLIVGDYNAEVTKILTVVDVTFDVLEYAKANKYNLIVAHHPIIFNARKTILKDDYIGELLLKAIAANINIYAAHTNMDRADIGINFRLAKELDGRAIHASFDDNIGVIFNIDMSDMKTIINRLDEIIFDGVVRCYESDIKSYNKLAIISGSGGRDESSVKYLIEEGVQLFITAEFKNNIENELIDRHISYIEYNHQDSERIFEVIIAELLAETDIKVLKWSYKEA